MKTERQGLIVRLKRNFKIPPTLISFQPLRTNTGSYENGDMAKITQRETKCIEIIKLIVCL